MTPSKKKKLILEFIAAFIVANGLFAVVRYRERGALSAGDWRAIAVCLAVSLLIVGAVVCLLRLLVHAKKTEPNQALEPTSTAVTPPAVAGDRASGTRGSP